MFVQVFVEIGLFPLVVNGPPTGPHQAIDFLMRQAVHLKVNRRLSLRGLIIGFATLSLNKPAVSSTE